MHLFNLGSSKKKWVGYIVIIFRQALVLFFIKFQMITFVELAYHDISRSQRVEYVVSYILSTVVTGLFMLEVARAYKLVKKGYTKKVIESPEFNSEERHMHQIWTADLKEKEKYNGNTYMIRDRLRWVSFQLIIAGLQKLPMFQISLIMFIQLVYVMAIYKENYRFRIYKSLGMKIKYVLQEIAIVIFLVILTIFTAVKSESFRKSQAFFALETVIIVAVFVAIGSELIAIGWSVKDSI